MKRYLLSVWQPDGPPPRPEALEEILRGVAAWRQELEAAEITTLPVEVRPLRDED